MENEALITAFETIADKLGIAAVEIFRIFTEVQMVKGILTILSLITLIVLVYGTIRGIFKALTGYSTYRKIVENCDDEYDMDDILMITVILTFLMIIIYAAIIVALNTAVIRILCPEYSAILDIVQTLT